MPVTENYSITRSEMFMLYVSNIHITYLLTPWSRVLLEKLTGSAASQEIPRIFGTRRFITAFTSARHLSLCWANSIQSPQPPPTSWRSILILSSHLRLGLPSGLFPSGFPTSTLCTPTPLPHTRYMSRPSHSSRLQQWNTMHSIRWSSDLELNVTRRNHSLVLLFYSNCVIINTMPLILNIFINNIQSNNTYRIYLSLL